MTTPTPPSGPQRPTPDDTEVVHAYLDGEARPAEVARIEGDPALRAAVDVARAAQADLRSRLPVPGPDDETRQSHIAAAVDAFDAASLAQPITGSPAPVADLGARRDRKAWYQRVPLPALAAAAVVLLVAVVAGIAQLGSSGNDDVTATAGDGADEADTLEDAPMAADAESIYAEQFEDDAGGPAQAIPHRDLARSGYDTIDDFVAALRSRRAHPAATATDDGTTAGGLAERPMADLVADCPDLADRYADFDDAYQVSAEVDGDPVIGVVFTDDGDIVVEVIDPARCEVVAED